MPVPDDVETVWLRTRVRTQTYGYDYSFDGEQWHDLGVELDAKILSDDYVNQRYGGFFTGAFVGLAAVICRAMTQRRSSWTSITAN